MKFTSIKTMLSAAVVTTAAVGGLSVSTAQAEGMKCESGETYIMNVMVSGNPYWVPVFEGMKQAAAALGCEVVFSGTPEYDVNKQIASFEQDLVKKPAAIIVHPMNADPFIEPINRAIANGTEIVTFAADSPRSNRVSYVTSDNTAEAAYAVEEIAGLLGGEGKYGVLENPGQSNHDLRVTEFIRLMKERYPGIKLVGRQATNQDASKAYQAISSMLQAHPDLGAIWIPEASSAEGAVAAKMEAKSKVVIMHADITPTTLDHIRKGNIHKALNPNQGVQGFQSMMLAFLAKHSGHIDPFNDYKRSGFNPMGVPYMDNGFAVITKDNADDFVLEDYMANR